MEVTLQPEQGRLAVTDRILWPDGAPPRQFDLLLNDGLQIAATDAVRLARLGLVPGNRRLYRLELGPAADALTLSYEGIPFSAGPSSQAGMPKVVLDSEGVYLDGASAWYPQIGDYAVSAELSVHHPREWRSVSQGTRRGDSRVTVTHWISREPQDEIYLLAGPYHLYTKPGRHAEAQAFLRSPDAQLAQRYLDITDRYLDLYSRLIGPYPYPKFAVVENRWETGYGMPSFTLLGPRVMRLPFLLISSYPHEILHNWWGNSVYPDYARGNWSEGLTSYLADHLLQEQRGDGHQYRLATLQKYADYVVEERDFPLRQFRARHDGASQAVGYGKTLMVFHMLRREIGDAAFRDGLQRLYRNHRYRVAGFEDLQQEFEAAAERSLAAFFTQWIERTGAPALVAEHAEAHGNAAEGFQMRLRLHQSQEGSTYQLRIPVAITLEGDEQALMKVFELDERRGELSIQLSKRPIRIDIDPRFDVFRRLSPDELPPSLGQVFGATRITVVVPEAADIRERQAYEDLAQQWQRRFPQLQIQDDTQPLPTGGGVWILGKNNRYAATVLQGIGKQYAVEMGQIVRLGDEEFSDEGLSVVLTQRRDSTSTLAYLQPGSIAAISALARKLPHYGKYSYLAFSGDTGTNVGKGRWPVTSSPLTVSLTPEHYPRGQLPSEPVLIE